MLYNCVTICTLLIQGQKEPPDSYNLYPGQGSGVGAVIAPPTPYGYSPSYGYPGPPPPAPGYYYGQQAGGNNNENMLLGAIAGN